MLGIIKQSMLYIRLRNSQMYLMSLAEFCSSNWKTRRKNVAVVSADSDFSQSMTCQYRFLTAYTKDTFSNAKHYFDNKTNY